MSVGMAIALRIIRRASERASSTRLNPRTALRVAGSELGGLTVTLASNSYNLTLPPDTGRESSISEQIGDQVNPPQVPLRIVLRGTLRLYRIIPNWYGCKCNGSRPSRGASIAPHIILA